MQCEGILLVAETLKTDNSVAADTVDEGKDAGQDLDLEFDDEKRGIFDVDVEEAGIKVFGRECLFESQSACHDARGRKREAYSKSLVHDPAAVEVGLHEVDDAQLGRGGNVHELLLVLDFGIGAIV